MEFGITEVAGQQKELMVGSVRGVLRAKVKQVSIRAAPEIHSYRLIMILQKKNLEKFYSFVMLNMKIIIKTHDCLFSDYSQVYIDLFLSAIHWDGGFHHLSGMEGKNWTIFCEKFFYSRVINCVC